MTHDISSPFEDQIARKLRPALTPPHHLIEDVVVALDAGSAPIPRARRRPIRPILGFGAIAATAVALIVANAIGVARLPVGLPKAPGNVQAAPAVQARAVAALDSYNDKIVHVQTQETGIVGYTGVEAWQTPVVARAGAQVRERSLQLNGTPVLDQERIWTAPASQPASSCSGKGCANVQEVNGERLTVDYTHRTWSDQKSVPVPAVPSPGDPQVIRDGLANGRYQVVREEEIDGRRAIVLERPYPSGAKVREEYLWVDAVTYLPIKGQFVQHVGSQTITSTTRITFLDPTPDNLAQLRPPIPAGFVQTSIPTQGR